MKQNVIKAALFTAALTGFSWGALAHGNKAEATLHAIHSVIETFKTSETAETQAAFAGVKGWPSGTNLKVKVYLADDKTLDYLCAEDNSGHNEVMKCEKVVAP